MADLGVIWKKANYTRDRSVVLRSHNVRQRPNGQICATDMCKAGGKEWKHYKDNKEFTEELISDAGIPRSELIESKKGGSRPGGGG